MKKICFLWALGMILTASSALAVGYYEFSVFTGVPAYSVYDVATYGNEIYYGGGPSVYRTSVSIADTAKADEPYYLADGTTLNPNYQPRSFSSPVAISLSGYDGSLNSSSVGEMYVDDSYLYTLGYKQNVTAAGYRNEVVKFDKATGNYVETVASTPTAGGAITGTGWGNFSLLSYGGGKWWVGNEDREVYSLTPGDSDWTYQFTWANMAGSHGDGLEFVNGYLFVSDMTSNYIAQWGMGDNPDTEATETGWNEWNRFAYDEILGTSGKDVEGMGFGALNHFWAGNGTYLYELGGGEIQQYLGGGDDGPPPVPEPGTLFLLGAGLSSLVLARRRRSE
ncbi:PEP-CTERM sorting domain-containing protein [Geothermobacter hydrogeniphilus]|uniref:Ice-binding protein C-terminal domain-containing protein n=1 Tax=Geothermobacter hydrogeniphilus TaxID=1969733 RepID=A0A1X0Y4A7_9BACT|nr:PEP-CTERM sorting domain-containing protein [Geothermobacter hydrogeniphilus]ORJ59884.1 hypothetical protein B5V00_09440 [Geothermobacter hydrogeniphilus]